MSRRPAIPADVREKIKIEASYRCAVPRCLATLTLDVHHIDGNPSNNDLSNLIALCPTCHSAFHRKVFSVESIRFWKLMLQQLNAAFDRNAINLLLMLAELDETQGHQYEVTGDGLMAFSPLIASQLVDVAVIHRKTFGPLMPYYQIRLGDKGRATMKAWKEGDPKALPGAVLETIP